MTNNNNIKQSDSFLKKSMLNTVTTVTTDDEFSAMREDWRSLDKNSSKGNIFTSWDWLHLWWDIYKNDGSRQLYILKCSDDNNKLIGIAPFQIVNNPKKYFPCSKQLIMLGTGETDGSSIFGEYMDLIIVPGYETTVTLSLSQFLQKNASLWEGMKFHQILGDSHLQHLFEGLFDSSLNESLEKDSIKSHHKSNQNNMVRSIEAYGFRTIVALPETYKDYLMGLKKKMRNNITRTFSRLESEQDYTIESVDNPQDSDKAIAILAELNRSRRGDLEKMDSAFENSNFEKFHRRMTKILLSKKGSGVENNTNINEHYAISFRILRFKNEPVAALYSFIDGDTIHAYQSGFEKEAGHRYSLLTTMLTQEIAKSIENKSLKYYNFMYSDEETTYKRRYSGTSEVMYKISFDKNNIKFKLFQFIHGPLKEKVKQLMNR